MKKTLPDMGCSGIVFFRRSDGFRTPQQEACSDVFFMDTRKPANTGSDKSDKQPPDVLITI